MHRLLSLAVAIAAFAGAPALAAPFQDTAALDRAVAAFAGRGIGEEGGARAAVDGRLKLAACTTLSLSWRSDPHDAVVVACTGPEWRLFVPIRFAPSTPRPALQANAAAVAVAVKAEPVIKRGDPVTIEAGSPDFSITRDGVALGDAAPGGRLMVKVEGSTAPVQAVAIETGRAALPGWAQ